MDQTTIIERELKDLIIELKFELDDSRRDKLQTAKYVLEWILDHPRHIDPHDYL